MKVGLIRFEAFVYVNFYLGSSNTKLKKPADLKSAGFFV